MSETADIDLECRDVVKTFGSFTAVDGVSVSIPKGSFFSILGPSGCGKTTLLRMIAGFGDPTRGDILIKGRSVIGTPPNKRPANMVFQHLALFPMMSVADNIGYGLRRRGLARAGIRSRVDAVLARVGLPAAGGKRIDQLSGGQKQRIAIARCMVLDPTVLLLDEPLGSLDLKLREHMKVELKQLQSEFGTTFVYITHDQSEALVMSDRVAVMNAGRFEQVGTPQELYYRPNTAFVAGFVGDSNRWPGRVWGTDPGSLDIETVDGFRLVAATGKDRRPLTGDAVEVFVRPESITLHRAGSSRFDAGLANRLAGRVESLLFNGANSRVLVRVADRTLVSAALPVGQGMSGFAVGEEVALTFHADQCLCFPAPFIA